MGRATILALSVLAACGPAWSAEAPAASGPLLLYTFEEGDGAVLKDHSGHGHDGEITGGRWVESPRGMALAFDGRGGHVRIKKTDALQLRGDATFLTWIRTTGDDVRDRGIFTDGSGRAVHRNLSVILDKGTLSVSWGDGRDSESITRNVGFDGQWKHLALVFEHPRYYLYVDGSLAETGTMNGALTPTQGGDWYLGGWPFGGLDGEIGETRLYDRALSEREIVALHRGQAAAADADPDAEPVVQVRPGLQPSRRLLGVELLALDAPAAAVPATIGLYARGKDEALEEKSVELLLTRPGSERAVGQALFGTERLPPGDYHLRATVAPPGRKAAAVTADVRIPPPPAWLGSTQGVSDDVLPPYQPVEVAREGGSPVVSVWGRRYAFADGPLPSQVEAKAAALLAGPMVVRGTVDGNDVSWGTGTSEVASQTAAKAVVRGAARAGGLRLDARWTIEYDGFATVEWGLTAEEPVRLDGLTVEIPFARPLARYLYSWPTTWGAAGHSGAIEDGHASAFKPIIWIGDEERGLSWFCETDEHWRPEDPAKAFTVERDGDRVVLRLNLVGRATTIAPDRPLTYVFALQATPLKPVDRDCWDARFCFCPWYGHDYDMLSRQVEGRPALRYLEEKGCRSLIACNWTKIITYPWPVGWEEEFKRLVTACHEHGIALVPYLGYQICHDAPEYPHVRDEVVRLPMASNPDSYPGMPPQMVDTVCLRSGWQDALVDGVARMIDEFGIDGVYLDSTSMPFGCTNAAHGCGYKDADGGVHPTYPVFAVRETFRRLYTVVKRKKPDGIVDAHVFDCVNSSALAFATTYWNGEQLTTARNEAEGLPLDRFRTEMMGVNWGVPAEFLHYKLGSFANAQAISLLHDVPTRAVPGAGHLEVFDLSASIWKLADDFDRHGARFLPYWSHADAIGVGPRGCHASGYLHPQNGLLLIVSNLTDAAADVAVRLDRGKLGLPTGGLEAVDGLTRKPVAMTGDALVLPLPALGWQYVWIKPGR